MVLRNPMIGVVVLITVLNNALVKELVAEVIPASILLVLLTKLEVVEAALIMVLLIPLTKEYATSVELSVTFLNTLLIVIFKVVVPDIDFNTIL